MNKELDLLLTSALRGIKAENFSTEDTNEAAVNAIMKEVGLDENSSSRDFRRVENDVFALIEEKIDVILPKKIASVLGEFAEVKQFERNAEPVFNIEKVGKNRAKLTITKGARGGIYRAARLDNKHFTVNTSVYTVGMFVTLEEILLGDVTLAELYNNILEGFQEIVYKEVFNALASGSSAAGYDSINKEELASTTKDTLAEAIDKVMPIVKQYGVPTIFGSYQALDGLYNPVVANGNNSYDADEVRASGLIGMYKGAKVVELPNYLVSEKNDKWFYDPKYVFVIPSSAKPVKVALKGDLYLKQNEQATGSEKWEAHKLMGVGVAMANNFAVIKVTDVK